MEADYAKSVVHTFICVQITFNFKKIVEQLKQIFKCLYTHSERLK